MTDVKVLIVGCGSIGMRHARIMKRLGVARLALADPFSSRLEEAARELEASAVFRSYEEALQQGFDAVVLCTPPHLHVRQAMMAIQAGCDVLTEKPLSVNLEGIEELEQAANASAKIVMVGLCFRYHAGLLRVKQLIEQGAIGRLVSIRASIGEDLSAARPNVNYRKLYVTSSDVGVTLDLCHEPDFVAWMAGQPIESVTATTGKYSDLEMEGDDVAEILIRFKDRLAASVHMDFVQKFRRRTSEYIGTEGTILLDMADWNRATIACYRTSEQSWSEEVLRMERDDMFMAMDKDFLECISNRETPALDIRQGMISLQIALAARQSSRSGQAVRF